MRFFDKVHLLVRHIPAGRVASYGQIARLLEQPHAARTVGWAMRATPADSGTPWHRVVNAAGQISVRNPAGMARQRRLLEAEGVVFQPDGRIDMACFGWEGLSEPEVRKLMSEA
jgi:methylated-DNA-protein-cysteine methyltransferase-like protein